MASVTMESVAPLAVALPDPPADGPYTEDNWRTFLAVMDTVVPSVRKESAITDKATQLSISDVEYNTTVDELKRTVTNAPDSESLNEYLDERPSTNPRFQQLLKRTFVYNVREDARKGLGFILAALNTRVGCLMLTGSATPFYLQPPHTRESIVQRWRLSYLPPLNNVYTQITRIAKSLWLKTSPNFHKVSGFPAVPDHYQPGPHFEHEFMQFQVGTEAEIIETDVVIVGSGCGGAVAAKNLAEEGQKVMVVDKAYYYAPSQLPMTEEAGGIHLFDNGGADNTDDSSTTIVAGSSWGGGGTINWSASLQTQSYVRKEWAQDRGLTFFETAEFQNCLDRVCNRMGVSADHIRHNHGNRVILEGSRKLGYNAKAVPQNTGGNEHSCGHCTVGCGSAQKQGPVVAWLPDAAKAGAKFIEGFEAHHVIFDESGGSKRAVGVKGIWTSRNSKGGVDGPLSGKTVREVIIQAKKVVISSGTLWSPIILLNSGLTNHQIGKNLYLHPVNVVLGVFKEDIRPWEGGILTTVCSSFENLDGHGHGVKLEATAMLPSYILPLANWNSGLDFKTLALKYRHMNGFISIARDRDTGRVYPDPVSGKPRFQYTPSAFDRAHVMEGVIALAKICYVSGATEIHPCIAGVPAFVRNPEEMTPASKEDGDPGITDPRFKTWLEDLKKTGNKPPTAPFACAHQMGSNRMSAREKDGVVDPKGRVWGTDGLYVADASVFPSASGVNPMITNMAISDWISRGIGKELRGAGLGGSRL